MTSGFQNPLVHTDFDMFVDEFWTGIIWYHVLNWLVKLYFLSIVETADFADSDFKEMDAPLKGI